MNSSNINTKYNPPSYYSAPIRMTYNTLKNLMLYGVGVKEGQLYHITDKADTGILVMGTANPKNVEIEAIAGFYNCNFINDISQIDGDFISEYIFDNYTISINSGFIFIQTNNFIWSAANEAGYSTGNIIAYNGEHYIVLDDTSFDGNPPYMNFDAYALLPKTSGWTSRAGAPYTASLVGYIEEWDNIEFDFYNDHISKRKDKVGNEVGADFYALASIAGNNPITYFQWGNPERVYGNKVHNAIFDIRNNNGIAPSIANNTVINYSLITANFTEAAAGLLGCTFDNAGTHDLSAITKAYTGKVLTPHLSTFDDRISYNYGGSNTSLTIPSYVGIVYTDCRNISDSINSFDDTPTFERTFYSFNSTFDVRFNNTSNIVFDGAATHKTISSGKVDFIKFLWDSNASQFFETAVGNF